MADLREIVDEQGKNQKTCPTLRNSSGERYPWLGLLDSSECIEKWSDSGYILKMETT